jgi:hypothetical protein
MTGRTHLVRTCELPVHQVFSKSIPRLRRQTGLGGTRPNLFLNRHHLEHCSAFLSARNEVSIGENRPCHSLSLGYRPGAGKGLLLLGGGRNTLHVRRPGKRRAKKSSDGGLELSEALPSTT